MGVTTFSHSNILVRTPCESQDLHLYWEAKNSGATPFLDLGRNENAGLRALNALKSGREESVKIHFDWQLDIRDLPESVTQVMVLRPSKEWMASWTERVSVIVEVTSVEEALHAVTWGASALVLRGHEAAGETSDLSAFLFLQSMVTQVDIPLYIEGGIGPDTAAASMWGGATGVVLDSEIGLFPECRLPVATRDFLTRFDGTETRVREGFRFAVQPGLATFGKTDSELDSLAVGPDVMQHRVPMGQGGAFARTLADKYGTLRSFMTGLIDRVNAGLSDGKWMDTLAPDSPLAKALGLTYPVVQGPMTRVSDKAGFSAAVTAGGGLPFLALSLMRGEAVRTLLEQTAAQSEGTWGVGILGFAPPELREEQMALIEEFKPPVVLIAGGRPSQARSLEALGIRVYLHVPSAPLLEMFLKEGARHFVFEGRECGGHVGPRASFPLWQSQLHVLEKWKNVDDVSVLFAGGIHDGKSAAMISALAAPLAARGAQIGVLMGTAYLFTHEAESSGAIGSFFQNAVLACDKTALLETAPGHATRCVETPYVEAFRAERKRLEEEGLPQDQIWESLERLNLGRLRIATKGVVREGSELLSVTEERQEAEGMVMVGQVATLRHEKLTVEELHREVSLGSVTSLQEREVILGRQVEAEEGNVETDAVAIVGMACIFPGAPDLESYWESLLEGTDSVGEVPRERWNAETYFDPNGVPGESTPSKWGGFIEPLEFDPLLYGIPPKSLAAIEPVQLLSLEVARRALKHAGYESREFNRERTSVIFGAEAGTDLTGGYGFRALYPQYMGELPEELDHVLPSLTEDSFPGVLANVIAGRIANRLDLGGVNFTVDAACASSLAALELAVKELKAGTSDMVLCGGADLHNSINDYLMFSSVHALSRKGRCAPFDSEADGIALGEGIATLVLKRLSDARRDGDKVIAVVNGVAGASDGKSLGLTAPRQEGQVRALQRAYAQSGIAPEEVEMVEAHGTGTVVGDKTELATLETVFAAAPNRGVALGSVKSQIGHTKCAAGLAGVIKGALAVSRGIQLPTLHIDTPNPGWNPEKSPFTFLDRARPWLSPVRRVGISAFGFGGTNFHAIVSGAERQVEDRGHQWSTELFAFRGSTLEEAKGHAIQLHGWLEAEGRAPLRNLAFEAASMGEGQVQLAFVATDRQDLLEKLSHVKAGTSSKELHLRGESPGKVAFLMSGQGSQRPGMLLELFLAFPKLRELLRDGEEWLERLFPPQAMSQEETKAQRSAVTDTRVAQPTLGMADMAAYRLFALAGVTPDMAGGHSYGEWPALCAAGVISSEQLLRISAERARSILDAAGEDPGTMASVRADAQAVEEAIASVEGVVIANLNSPTQTVISGTTEGVANAVEALEQAGLKARTFPVACAFHSPVLADADRRFADVLQGETLESPKFPVWSNTHVQPHGESGETIREWMSEHLVSPVRFSEQIEAMYEDGARVFVECGPGRVQTGLVSSILGERAHHTFTTEIPGDSAVDSWLKTLASMVEVGCSLDPTLLFSHRGCDRIDLSNPKKTHPSPSIWWVNGHTAWPDRGELPSVAMRPTPEVPVKHKETTEAVQDPQATVVMEFLGGMREAIQAQRDVVLGYLGTAPNVRIQPAASAVVEASTAPVSVEATPQAPQAPEKVEAEQRSITEILLELVSDRTGYPMEMIGMEMDLEADLSIDSIKRIEILGGLSEEMGWADDTEMDRDAMVEDLAALKTLSEIVAWLEQNGRQAGSPSGGEISIEKEDDPDGLALTRYELRPQVTQPIERNGVSLEGRVFGVGDVQSDLAQALKSLMEKEGASLVSMDGLASEQEMDGFLALDSKLDEDTELALFKHAQTVLDRGGNWLVAVTGQGRALGGDSIPAQANGSAGLIKSVAKEFPSKRVRILHMDREETPAAQAGRLMEELVASDQRVEVMYHGGDRSELLATETPAGGERLLLPENPVVLVTGGARGITALSLLALAKKHPLHAVICGRSPEPGPEPSQFANATTLAEVRERMMGEMKGETPAKIEAACMALMRAREFRSTLQQLEHGGSTVQYVSLDVRDEEAFGALIDSTYEEHGRLDGVIHGAGVIEDKGLLRKDVASFQRVFDTKVVPARVLAKKLNKKTSFVAFFSSVSSAFGNKGQADYAAANTVLDQIADQLNAQLEGRVVSINWGPWGGTGMVSPSLEKEYAKRGVGLIPPDEGAEAFLQEIAMGSTAVSQVVWMCAKPEAMV